MAAPLAVAVISRARRAAQPGRAQRPSERARCRRPRPGSTSIAGRTSVGCAAVGELRQRSARRTGRSSQRSRRIGGRGADDASWRAGPTRTVFVERVSSAISSASVDRRGAGARCRSRRPRRRRPPASSRMVPSLPLCAASCAARPSLNVAVGVVAGLARLEAVLDALGELGLPRVVRDLAADPGRQLLVVGPDRLDQALARAPRRPRRRLIRPASISSPSLARRDVDAHVVVARFRAPGAGRIVGGERRSTRYARSVRSSIVGATCRTNADARRPAASRAAATTLPVAFPIAATDHRAEVGSAMSAGIGDDVDASRAASTRSGAARRPPSRCRRRGSRTGTALAGGERWRRAAPASRARWRRRSAGSRGTIRARHGREQRRRQRQPAYRSPCRRRPRASRRPLWRGPCAARMRGIEPAVLAGRPPHALSVPAMTPNSDAVADAVDRGSWSRLARLCSFDRGTSIDPDASTITISAASGRLAGAVASPAGARP